MIAIVKEPQKEPKICEIEDKLEVLKNIVGGGIEIVSLCDDIVIVCDDEGKLKHYNPNLQYGLDILCGTVIFVSTSGEDLASLNPSKIKYILTYCELFKIEV